MNTKWEKKYILRANDFDKFDRIMPSAILDLFQDAAGRHAEEIGVGLEDMFRRSYLWVIVRIKFKILSAPKRYQEVTVKTWPLPPDKLHYRREYCMENEAGERLVVGSSEWVVVHSEKRRFVSDPDLYSFKEGFCEERMFPEKLGRIKDFEAVGEPRKINPGFCELDINNHVNNTKYANYVLAAINPEKDDEIEEFQIEYRKEVMEGEELNIYHLKDGNEILAKGESCDGSLMFSCRITNVGKE